MKIADALQLQQDLSKEIGRLSSLAEQKAWGFMQRGAGEELAPNFDLGENHKRIVDLSKLKRRLSKAVRYVNSTIDIDIDELEYLDWL